MHAHSAVEAKVVNLLRQVTRELFEKLASEEKAKWTLAADREHTKAIAEWSCVFKGPVPELPAD